MVKFGRDVFILLAKIGVFSINTKKKNTSNLSQITFPISSKSSLQLPESTLSITSRERFFKKRY